MITSSLGDLKHLDLELSPSQENRDKRSNMLDYEGQKGVKPSRLKEVKLLGG